MPEQLLQPILVFLGVLIALGGISAYLATRSADFPYEAREGLLSPAERLFHRVLYQAIEDDQMLFTKVRLADILRVQRKVTGKHRYRAFNRIACKHADFVVCDQRTSRIVCVVELDDRSHQEEARVRRDRFFDAAFEAAKIPVLHVPARRSYSAADLRVQLRAAISGRSSSAATAPA